MITSMDLLLWVRGPGFSLALAILLFGVTLRLFELFMLGRKPDLSAPRARRGSGWRTMFARSVPDAATFRRSAFTFASGYIFHLGFFATLFLFRPHIMLFQGVTGLSWPGLPSTLVDAVAVVTIITLAVVTLYRLLDPVKRFLSTAGDWVALAVTALPLITGYMTYHHLWVPYQWMLGLHILSVELLMVVLPFTKLTHSFTLFISRWFNGDAFARKGVAS